MIRLIFVDMSKTLVKGSGANSGAEYMGRGDTYRNIYPEYTEGKISMENLLEKTYACWKGLKVSDLPEVYKTFEFNDGAKDTIKKIKEKGIKTALLTQIPTHLGNLFRKDPGFDYISGTVLEVKDGAFTGKVLEYHHNKEKEALRILKEQNIPAHEAISIGDRKDDAEVFKILRFGVAYNGDEAAKKAAKYRITDFSELMDIIEKESS